MLIQRRAVGFLAALWALGMGACWAGVASAQPSAPAELAPAGGPEVSTQEAMRLLCDRSDRYLHHDRLRPGMTGYGLTVMEGHEIVRFDVQIVSVMLNWGPRQDVILARLSGQGLEKTGPVQGMSGSPIYVRDERDGKDKIIGAMAYGWALQKDCLVGIQPISQMLQIDGFLHPGGSPQAVRRGGLGPQAMSKLLDGRKIDFLKLAVPSPPQRSVAGAGQLLPLATPLTVSGLSPRVRDLLAGYLEATSLVAIGGGSSGQAPASQIRDGGDLQPGSPLGVLIVEGDLDFSAMGTVTDVVDGRVIGFGHSFVGEGPVCLPLSGGYVHAVVPSLMTSFKLGSPLPCVGALTSDAQTGVAGVVGQSAQMIPMAVRVTREDGRPQQFHYRLAQHRWLTPLMGAIVAANSVMCMSDLPIEHTVRYRLRIELEGLAPLEVDNVSSQDSIYAVISDLTRPLVAMMDSPLGPPARVNRLDLDIEVLPRASKAEILDLALDGRMYQPGQTVTGTLRLQPYRQPVTSLPVRLTLPADLDEGRYTLSAGDAESCLAMERSDMPQRFDPRTNQQLWATIRHVLQRRGDMLYLHLPLDRGGVAIDKQELDSLPPSRRAMLTQQPRYDIKEFERALVHPVATPYVLSGQAQASFEVLRRPREIPLQSN